ncbi:hypothetical protein [Marasmitruncus massiliensis]|uniref:hypothetical protein n=1 Tax=Marasmitruncus massiliensis TaxID=1944642 RepID=UPI0015E0E08C|nr:hypothetical protein [Marasmitruncus massiliensis]
MPAVRPVKVVPSCHPVGVVFERLLPYSTFWPETVTAFNTTCVSVLLTSVGVGAVEPL